MRSSVSVILSSPVPDSNMSHPDYEQTAHDHAALLVLLKLTGEQSKQKNLGRILDRVARVNQAKVTDCVGVVRDVSARYIRDYPVENNDWGDYQTHRRLLGLITIGKYENQTELNELCRVHESLKVKYSSTLYDSRCVLLGPGDSEPSSFPTPSNFKARALRYHDGEACAGMEAQISEFLSSLFWVLESKRLERSREKVEKVSLLLAPFEKKDIVGLDLESRANRKRCVGRMTKHLGDLSLQAGLPADALAYYTSAAEVLKAVGDWLWLGGACEGLCAASVVVLYPNCGRSYPLQRNASLQEGRPRAGSVAAPPAVAVPAPAPAREEPEPSGALSPDEISKRYREAIIHYSKYKNAGIVEMEASYKAARVAVDQGWTLQAASFLQNVVFIDVTLTELEKVQRFTSLADLYGRIGFHRKASFCLRLAATRYVSAQNPQPDWGQCYQLMLQALSGHSISLDPAEFTKGGRGWPCLQVQLLQELVVAARRSGLPALATRHATFLLQCLWGRLGSAERRDLALQLRSLAAQCEGAPVPLVLRSGAVIPPVNLTGLPHVRSFVPQNLPPQLRPKKIVEAQEDCGPFLFTPIHFGSLERRNKTSSSKLDFLWVEGDPCEVTLELFNPLPLELKVSNMMLLTCGCVFESLPSSLSLPPESGPHSVTLSGVPKETGELQLQGYSTHTLGVKSNCRLRSMPGFSHPHYTVDVIPALPHMQVSTSLPKQLSPTDTTSGISLYAGESAEVSVVLANVGAEPVDWVDVSLDSLQRQVFQWSQENLQAQLPLAPAASASLTLYLRSVHDFVLPAAPSEHDASCSPAYGSLMSGPGSLPLSLDRKTDATPSIRSGSSGRSHSSLASSQLPLTKLSSPSASKMLEGQLKLSYSGGAAHESGYCRVCTTSITIEMLPSVQITGWDVLPAETSSQFYLVLDVANLTCEELELHYTPTKFILIEALESCRVPVPLDRCPLSKLAKLYQCGDAGAGESDRGELDAVCSEHIASLVDLRWTMPSCGREGRIPLRGMTLTPAMLDLVRMSPLHWDVSVDQQAVRPQEDLTASAGQCVQLSVRVRNSLERTLLQVALQFHFYQDGQGHAGFGEHRLETRLATAGPSKVIVPQLEEQATTQHSCCVVFFTPGQYKVDIQCSSLLSDVRHTWRFIPPVAFTVVE
ncbi:protein brunelleschi isoform X2 [Bacillus rossius redtenbacheri]|uniref:protein brunelleschi isoform X2 n=1 Tax=Bacillus rossius redtenbacheri TaxID=93214 RepID=UPI002FDCCC96